MNLSPDWVPLLAVHGWEACHWSTVGPGNAPDTALMQWARENNHVVLTQDLDFSQILYTTRVRVVPVLSFCAWIMNLMLPLVTMSVRPSPWQKLLFYPVHC